MSQWVACFTHPNHGVRPGFLASSTTGFPDAHKVIYCFASTVTEETAWADTSKENLQQRNPPHNRQVGKSCSSWVFGSCCISQCPLTYLVSSLCTLCFAKDWQFMASCPSGLSPRAKYASWTAVYKLSYLHQVYCSTESWTLDVESADPCHEFSIRSASRRGFFHPPNNCPFPLIPCQRLKSPHCDNTCVFIFKTTF